MSTNAVTAGPAIVFRHVMGA
ncbi:MAG: hypothetical protein RL693_1970, partial [Verrucomicrobiota bacterium]